jgi:MSHA pilin protein MshD
MIIRKPVSPSVRQKGVTLVELVISIVVLSIAMVALMNAFSVSMSGSADPLWRNKSLKLAQLYLDEILSKRYDHNTHVGGLPFVTMPSCTGLGPDPGETDRADYNDVDDYNGLTESPPKSLTGNLDSSYTPYSISVSVVCDGTRVGAMQSSTTGSNAQAKKISITITPPNQPAITFAVYRGNF